MLLLMTIRLEVKLSFEYKVVSQGSRCRVILITPSYGDWRALYFPSQWEIYLLCLHTYLTTDMSVRHDSTRSWDYDSMRIT